MRYFRYVGCLIVAILFSVMSTSAQECDTTGTFNELNFFGFDISSGTAFRCYRLAGIEEGADAVSLTFDIQRGRVRVFYRSDSMTNFLQLSIDELGVGQSVFIPNIINDETMVIGVQYLEQTTASLIAFPISFEEPETPDIQTADENGDPVTIPYIATLTGIFAVDPQQTLSIPIQIDCAGQVSLTTRWFGDATVQVALRGNGRSTPYNQTRSSSSPFTFSYTISTNNLAQSNVWAFEIMNTNRAGTIGDVVLDYETPTCRGNFFTQTVSVPPTCPNTLPSRLNRGDNARVTLLGTANNVRSGAGTNFNRIGQLAPGAPFTVLEGPSCANGYAWYRVQGDGITGWTAEALDVYWLEPLGTPIRSTNGATLLQNGRGLTNGRVVNNGEFQVEGYCTQYGYTVAEDGRDWFCVQGDASWTLLTVDFDRICRETYNRNNAFAVQTGRRTSQPAYSWRCYAP